MTVTMLPHATLTPAVMLCRRMMKLGDLIRIFVSPRISSYLLPVRNGIFFQIFFKFCALDLALCVWQSACARKIFSAHYILSSLALMDEIHTLQKCANVKGNHRTYRTTSIQNSHNTNKRSSSSSQEAESSLQEV